MLFPGNDPKQAAFDTMANEVNIGWNNGGLQSTLIGANLGVGIGCLSSLPELHRAAASSVESSARLPESAQESLQRKPERCAGRREVLRDSLSSAQLCVCPGGGCLVVKMCGADRMQQLVNGVVRQLVSHRSRPSRVRAHPPLATQ